MSVGCKPSSPCCDPGPKHEGILVYRNAHHAKSSPGNETFFTWNDNVSLVGGKFSGFPLLKKRICLAASTDVLG